MTKINGFTDPRLSFKAKGLLVALLQCPIEERNFDYLLRLSSDGKNSIQSGLKELEKYGYLKRTLHLDENSRRFSGYTWAVTPVIDSQEALK